MNRSKSRKKEKKVWIWVAKRDSCRNGNINNNNNNNNNTRISARRPDLIIINKKKRTCIIVDFAVPADHRIKLKECEKKDKYLDLARVLRKTMEHEGDNYTNYNWCVWNSN